MSMKKLKRVLPFSLAIILASVSLPVTALADSAKVVTLGANLSDEQKASMYKYFGTSADQVDTIEVTNTDERKYMGSRPNPRLVQEHIAVLMLSRQTAAEFR